MNRFFKKTLRLDLALCALCAAIFLLWPELDLIVAGNYYSNNAFTYADSGFVRFVYLLFAKIQFAYLLTFICGIYYCHAKRLLNARKHLVFLLLTLLLGPGLLVNVVLKDNSLGRPRPQHVQQFGGEMTFTPAFHYSGECARNCSFVSGHAAIGFYLLAFAWVRKRRIWFAYGVTLGLLVGLVRILQGGHFLSDVIFAGWVTYFCCAGTAALMGLGVQSPAEPGTAKHSNPSTD